MTPVERMKRFTEQRMTQKQVHTLQSKVMEVSQWLQPLQEKACQLITELEGQGDELKQGVITTEQNLQGPLNDTVIQEFTKQEAFALQHVKEARAKLEVFEEELVRPEWLGTSHRWVLGAYCPLTKFKSTWSYLTTFGTATAC